MKIFTKQNTKSIILALILMAGVGYVSAYSTWAPPTALPPNNNVDAPINVGGGIAGNTYTQTKSGILNLAHLFTSDLNVTNADGTVTNIPAGSVLMADGNNTGHMKWGTVGGSNNGAWSAIPLSVTSPTSRDGQQIPQLISDTSPFPPACFYDVLVWRSLITTDSNYNMVLGTPSEVISAAPATGSNKRGLMLASTSNFLPSDINPFIPYDHKLASNYATSPNAGDPTSHYTNRTYAMRITDKDGTATIYQIQSSCLNSAIPF